jgi:hypothetical protein
MQFDPGLVRSEFGELANTDLFLSGSKGQPSIEIAGLSIDYSWPPEKRGHSLFTFEMLNALRDKSKFRRTGSALELTADDLGSDLRTLFHSLQNPNERSNLRPQLAGLEWVPIPEITTTNPRKVLRVAR